MVQPKYSPEEALQRVKLMMGYDLKKTLKENVKETGAILNENKLFFEQVDIGNDVRDIKDELDNFNTHEPEIIKIIQKYTTAADFNKLVDAYKQKYQIDLGTDLRKAINTNDPKESKELEDHLKTLGITAIAKPTGDRSGTFMWVFDSGNKVPPKEDGKKQQQTPTIPKELVDAEGVKKFQDWLDKNKAGWVPGGVLNKSGGYGRFGPRTTRAWNSYGQEYLKGGTSKPEEKPEVGSEVQNVNATSTEF